MKTTLPIQEWVKDLAHNPKTEVAQALIIACWAASLGQCHHLSSLPLEEELQEILGTPQ